MSRVKDSVTIVGQRIRKGLLSVGRQALPILILCTGMCLLVYPWFANWMYERSIDSVVETYTEKTAGLDAVDTARIWEEARQYNEQLNTAAMPLTDPFLLKKENKTDAAYESILSVDGTGYLCAIEIPKIKVYLPVYHGTSESVLQKGAGHLEGSSFPVGGESTHAVLSAHTGLNTAKMFTDLSELEKGDFFFLHVLDQTLAYEVCNIQTVLPEEVEYLSIQKGRDLVTLLTCTPYGTNTHRLLVTGQRRQFEPGEEEQIIQKAEEQAKPSQWMRSYKRAAVIGLILTGVICIAGYVRRWRKRKRNRQRRARRRKIRAGQVRERNVRRRNPE